MKIAIIHPYKHHAYNSMAGIIKSGAEVVGLFGYYRNDDIIDKILSKSKYKKLLEGYSYEKVTNNIRTNKFIKILYLLNKLFPNKIEKVYLFFFQIWSIWNIKEVDYIHVLQDYCNIIIRYAKKHNIGIIYEQITAYDMKQFIDKKSNINKDRKLIRQKENFDFADYILLPSKFVKTSITNHITLDKIESKLQIIPYGADIKNFEYNIKKYDGKRKLQLVTVARICKGKGIEYLIEAMNAFDKEITLNYIGAINSKEYKLYNDLIKCKNVNYVGTIPHSQISEYLKKCDVFILPSLAEGSSLSVYEALACGMPCIVTNNVGSIITNNIEGLIIREKDVQAIIEAVKSFIDNPELVENMSRNIEETLEEVSWDNYEKKIAQFYIHNICKKE